MDAVERLVYLGLILSLMAVGILACAGDDSESSTLMTKGEARKVAEEAFKKEWGKVIGKYKIRDSESTKDDASWRFFFEGTEEFARPGYHVIVKVNRQTGQVEFVGGE